jgi:integrase
MKKNITAAFVDSVKAPERGQVDVWDQRLHGFGLRLSQGGRRTWMIVYRHQGRQRRFKLGTYPPLLLADAREMARGKLAQVQMGTDVAAMKQTARDGDTFADLADRYMNEFVMVHNRPRTQRDKKWMLTAELLPKWGQRQAASITRREIIELVDAIGRRAPIHANRCVALISSIFNFALDKEILGASPALRIPMPGKETARARTLCAEEIAKVWGALDNEGAVVAGIFRLAMLTAQRKSEIAGMEWSELDLDAGWWSIPAARTKAGRAHRVPLTAAAVDILGDIQAGPHDPVYVFRGGRVGKPISHLGQALHRVRARAGIEFWLHDLRRTAATEMGRLGVSQLVIGRILNHADGTVTARHYALYEHDREKREALDKLEHHILTIIAPAASDAVELGI